MEVRSVVGFMDAIQPQQLVIYGAFTPAPSQGFGYTILLDENLTNIFNLETPRRFIFAKFFFLLFLGYHIPPYKCDGGCFSTKSK